MSETPFRVQVRSVRLPGWLLPLMALLGLAMIPVAIALALGVLGLVLVAGIARMLLPGPRGSLGERTRTTAPRLGDPAGDVIDVEYEAKDRDEKG